jgi:hypothetical protein
MLGNTSGFAALVKNEVPHVVITHCILHRQQTQRLFQQP